MKTFALLLAIATAGLGPRTETRLRIESFSPRAVQVDVSSGPAGLSLDSAHVDSVTATLRVLTPATVIVADSVEWLRVVVVGTGAVKLLFDDAAAQPGRRPLWGRDVRLRRVNGRFQPTTQIIPLHP